jgi:hypothetical protein
MILCVLKAGNKLTYPKIETPVTVTYTYLVYDASKLYLLPARDANPLLKTD